MGVIAIKQKAVYIYNNEEERKNIFSRYNPKPYEYMFFGDNKHAIKEALGWAETDKIIGMKVVSEMNNLSTLNMAKKNNVSAVKISTIDNEFLIVINSFYFLNTNIRLEYDDKSEKLRPIIYTGKRENAMKDLESRIYNYGLKTSKFFDSAAVSYFLDFNKILGFIPIRLFSEKRFSRYGNEIIFSSVFEDFSFIEKEGLIIKNFRGNKKLYDEDIYNIEGYFIPEKYSNDKILNTIHFLERGGFL